MRSEIKHYTFEFYWKWKLNSFYLGTYFRVFCEYSMLLRWLGSGYETAVVEKPPGWLLTRFYIFGRRFMSYLCFMITNQKSSLNLYKIGWLVLRIGKLVHQLNDRFCTYKFWNSFWAKLMSKPDMKKSDLLLVNCFFPSPLCVITRMRECNQSVYECVWSTLAT